MDADKLLIDFHKTISPKQFVELLEILLKKMGFSEVRVTDGPGDKGVDLEAIWEQMDVPGLMINLRFKIQAKNYTPGTLVTTEVVNAIKGTMRSGDWGMLITTGRVTSSTRALGLDEAGRQVAIIDGANLIELCKKYGVGIRKDYQIDLTTIKQQADLFTGGEKQLSSSVTVGLVSRDLISVEGSLRTALGGDYHRIGNTILYTNPEKNEILIVRSSQYYDRGWSNYWYGITPKDLERVDQYGVTHFAFICDVNGIVLITASELLKEISDGSLNRTPSEGALRHYHIHLEEKDGSIYWKLIGRSVDVTINYHSLDVKDLP